MAALLAAMAIAPAARASEGGTGNFGVGAVTVVAGALPPPGTTESYGYLLYYSADSYRDDAGHSAIPGFKADLVVQALRVMHTWQARLWGLDLSSSLIGESIYAKVRAAGNTGHSFGPDLVCFDPFHIGGVFGNWYLQTGTYFYLPLGPYDPKALANSTTHYRSLAQEVSMTWMPTPRWEASVDANVSFNQRNEATGYRSGDLLGFTYGLGYRPFAAAPQWQLGLNGYYEQQFTDDRQDGAPVPTGARLRKFSVGPQAVYWFSPAAALVLKWQHELDVRNAPRGDLLWLQFALPL
jgi:hypothetical protein